VGRYMEFKSVNDMFVFDQDSDAFEKVCRHWNQGSLLSHSHLGAGL
jgi:hypothetical protein